METEINSNSIGPKDVFMQLLAMILFYISAVSFLVLVFQTINLWITDPAFSDYYSAAGSYSAIRWAIAFLIVVFPIYIGLTRYLRKVYFRDEARSRMKIRRWLTYFILFAAALTFIITLVVLVFRLLDGEITLRFVLKSLAVFGVAVLSFWYYYLELKAIQGRAARILFAVAAVLVVAAVAGGFIFAGSPSEGRAKRFDEQRIRDLESLHFEVLRYWQTADRLPENLDELKPGSPDALIDPESRQRYEYNRLGELGYELCAVFNQENSNFPSGPYGILSWEAGRNCFSYTIDPERDDAGIYAPTQGLKRVE